MLNKRPAIYYDVPPGGGTSGGGGPDDGARTLESAGGRSQGYLAVAFGLALGLTLMVFFGIFRAFPGLISEFRALQEFVAAVYPNLWLSFVFGFVGGTLISAIYNMLVVRRLNLFGLEYTHD